MGSEMCIRDRYAGRAARVLYSYDESRARSFEIPWDETDLLVPSFTGRRSIEVPLETLGPFIDWTFFFAAWELKGKFPEILDHPDKGSAARELYKHASELLATLVDKQLLTARGVYGFWPANADRDDIVVFDPAAPGGSIDGPVELTRFNMLRQQELSLIHI